MEMQLGYGNRASSSFSGFSFFGIRYKNLAKILVTGGCGFVGSCVGALAALHGHHVEVLDDLSSAYFSKDRRFKVHIGCISDTTTLTTIYERFKPDFVFHFAALSVVSKTFENEIFCNKVNFSYASNLMNFFVQRQVPVFFASTAAVYSSETQTNEGYSEDDESEAPLSPYAVSKLKAEGALRKISVARNVPSIAFRFFNAAGALPDLDFGEYHQPETHLIPSLVRASIKQDQKFTIFGHDFPTSDGTAIRDYVHVFDIANAFLIAIGKICDIRPGTVINLGSSNGYSVKSIIDRVENILDTKFIVDIRRRRIGDPARLVANNSRAVEILNWRPKKNLDEMILDTHRFLTTKLKTN